MPPFSARLPVRVVSPVTPRVPAIEVLPVAAETVNLEVFTERSLVTARVPPMVVLPETPRVEPTLRAPPIPSPPATVRAPVEELVEAVELVEAMVPAVWRLPSSSMVRLAVPLDWIERAVLVAAFVSLMIKEGAVPALVREKEVAVPESED